MKNEVGNRYGKLVVDTSKDYCPENCRWLTKSDNSKHRQGTYKPIRGEGTTK